MKVLFAGTPEFAVSPLQALITDGHEIVGVFTQPDRKAGRGKKLTPPPVKVAATEAGLPIFQPSNLKDQSELIESLSPDVMVVVAYGMLLPQTILDIPKLGCINIHASILPRWRGAAPIQRAIECGDPETGVSIMRMELGLDTGPVYQVLKETILPDDTSSTMHDKLSALGSEGICNTLKRLATDPGFKPISQDDGNANYAKKITKKEGLIDWSLSAQDIEQRIRAFTPWPICQTFHGENRIRIWQARPINTPQSKSSENIRSGQIIAITDDYIEVACGQGILQINKLQRDGGKPLEVREFCNGYSLKINDVLT